MSVEQAALNQATLLSTIGKAALNARYPNEFELYVCALELVDQTGKTMQYFIFPVNPSSMDESQPKLTNIKKTLAGVTVLSSPTFVPIDITLTGTFGRKFKVLLGSNFVDVVQSFTTSPSAVTTDNSDSQSASSVFDARVKTGYGCLKILQEIIDGADVIDENGPRRLIFYNPAFGSSYVVKPTSFKIAMSQESNMVHNYYLSLKAIAPLNALQSAQQLQDEAATLNTTAYVQTQANAVLNDLATILAK